MTMRWMAMLCVALTLAVSGLGQGKTVTYIHTDALSSPVLETNHAGQVVRQLDYRAYGEEVLPTTQEGPGYTGHYRDTGSGLVYMQQRYYDPVAGRFLSVDPVSLSDNGDLRHFNRYSYAYNNPYTYIDPDGRAPVVVPLAIAAGRCAGNAACRTAVANGARTAGRSARTAATWAGTSARRVGNGLLSVYNGVFNETTESDQSGAGDVGDAGHAGDTDARDRIKELLGDNPSTEDIVKLGESEDWKWQGTGEPGSDHGAMINTKTREQIHNDLDTHREGTRKGPHVTYRDPQGQRFDYFPSTGEATRLRR